MTALRCTDTDRCDASDVSCFCDTLRCQLPVAWAREGSAGFAAVSYIHPCACASPGYTESSPEPLAKLVDDAARVRTGPGAELVAAAVVVVAVEFAVVESARGCSCPRNYGLKNLCRLASLAEFEGSGIPAFVGAGK